MNTAVNFLPYLSTQIPEVLALIAGVVVALVNLGKDRRKAGYGLIAFALALAGVVASLVLLFATVWLQTGAGASELVTSLASSGGNCAVNLLPAAAWVLILLALFGGRGSPAES
ncbi:hypothetical protein [Fodinicola acaciae]|uniref:hypothetical protein n=1 Tax=Fodinicola acaciae TaxID=2681555 RepID=UPI0013D42144|nr:hypothetical protein [Fodinicola acaciae]